MLPHVDWWAGLPGWVGGTGRQRHFDQVVVVVGDDGADAAMAAGVGAAELHDGTEGGILLLELRPGRGFYDLPLRPVEEAAVESTPEAVNELVVLVLGAHLPRGDVERFQVSFDIPVRHGVEV